MENNGIFEEQKAARLMYRVLQALNHIHSNGVVHRDMKPDNIMVGEDGEPKIIDFGLSREIGGEVDQGVLVGSKMFMAPEIIERTNHSYPCDMWSLGIILWMMLSGGYPFDLKNLEHEIVNEQVIFLPEWDNVS